MSLEIVTRVREKYPTPLGGQHRAFLDEVARALGLGLVRKTIGTFIPYPQPVGGVSQDVVMARDGRAWDILVDADGVATASFNGIDPIDAGRYVDPASPAPTVSSAPAAASGDVGAELVRIRTLLERLCAHMGLPQA